MTSRSVIGAICLLLGVAGIYQNIQHGLPANPPPGFVIGLYTPAVLLIVVSISLFVSDWSKRPRT